MAEGDGHFMPPLKTDHIPPWRPDFDPLQAMELTSPLVYLSSGDRILRVPEGFRSDGASVPRLLRWAVPRYDYTLWAGFLHDYLIRHRIVSDREADAIFHEALRASGVSKSAARRMWAAVRLGSLVRAYERWSGHRGWVLPDERWVDLQIEPAGNDGCCGCGGCGCEE